MKSLFISAEDLLNAEDLLRLMCANFDDGTQPGAHVHFIGDLVQLALKAQGITLHMPDSDALALAESRRDAAKALRETSAQQTPIFLQIRTEENAPLRFLVC